MASRNQNRKLVDPCSFSNPSDYLCTKIRWDVLVCFSDKTLDCTANVEFTTKQENVNVLILDTRDLRVTDIKDSEDDTRLSFSLSKPHKVEAFGSQLNINIPTKYQICGTKFGLIISYQTSPIASALQWLTPEQTAGKKQPYLFTQCQPIHARSIIPCQDTPAVKFPYEANVSVPKELVALMSACQFGEENDSRIKDNKIYKFQQKIPIPSYLLALVVGALCSRKLGPRSHVWSEKETVEQSAYEFSQVEDMIQVGEKLLGPYVWGVYDLLVLPPSFPYGGMENPCLTFVTPTLLAGDRSLADVVVHEISHSWTGNLVTNENWNHFWLNEGFTRFVEGKIVGRLHGEPTRHLKAIGGWKSLIDAIKKFETENPSYSSLVVNLKESDPDDAFSSVPYEKGAAFLFYLEQIVGNSGYFEDCLKSWIEKYQYQTVVSDDWKDFFLKYFQNKVKKEELDKIQWDEWFYTPGMPPVDVSLQYDTSLADTCTELSQKWLKASKDDFTSFSSDDVKDFTPAQTTVFLDKLLLEKPLEVAKLMVMEEEYHFNSVGNSEIRFRWLKLCIRTGWEASFPLTVEFLLEQGRMKYIRPLYEALYKCENSRELALKTFRENRHIYHPIAVAMVAKELHLTS